MKKIAVWGYGPYGKQLIQSIETYWDGLEVTVIYDRLAAEKKTGDPRLSTPDRLPDDHGRGLFEGVMIAVNQEYQYREIRDQLETWEIPVFELGREEDFFPAEAFAQDREAASRVRQEGYETYVFTDLFGTVSYAPSNGIMYLFDEKGQALKEHWDAYWVRDNFTHQFDFPVRFGDPRLRPVRMAGDWCILAKLWSFNYSHFLFESMDCVQLLEEAGFTGRYLINDRTYNREVLRLYGIPEERIFTVRDFKRGEVYSFERVWFPKLLKNDRRSSAPVLARFAGHMRAGLDRDPERYPSRLYVERSGSRKLLNAGQAVEKYGLTVINPDRLSVREQMNHFYNAELILSPHGANSANCLFMRPGTAMVETFGRNWVKYSYINALRATGVYYVPVVEGPIMPFIPGIPTDTGADYQIPEENLFNGMDTALQLLRQG